MWTVSRIKLLESGHLFMLTCWILVFYQRDKLFITLYHAILYYYNL